MSNRGNPLQQRTINQFFPVNRAGNQQERNEHLFFEAKGVTRKDLKPGVRVVTTVNDKEIAIINHNNMIYAILEKCPHLGGPLSLGDIEDVPGCAPRIKCPHHKWTFDLVTGQCSFPCGDRKPAETFPVRVKGNVIEVGFTSFSSNLFNTIPE